MAFAFEPPGGLTVLTPSGPVTGRNFGGDATIEFRGGQPAVEFSDLDYGPAPAAKVPANFTYSFSSTPLETPEPATATLAPLGLVVFLVASRRRKPMLL
jgi:hypothetical protein